jgi:hypothetical protein
LTTNRVKTVKTEQDDKLTGRLNALKEAQTQDRATVADLQRAAKDCEQKIVTVIRNIAVREGRIAELTRLMEEVDG